jgi:segregation and condensation protein B
MNTETGGTATAEHEGPSAHSNGHACEAETMTAVGLGGVNGLKGIVEALLFVSGEPLTIDRLLLVIDGASRAEVHQAMRMLQEDYAADGRGLQIGEIAGGYQIGTRADCAAWIKRLEKAKTVARLSRSAMEALAIIAYKQPLVRAEIEQIRGVDTAGVLRTLLDRRLIRIIGRKDIPGRPIMYGTTKQFLQAFGLKDLSDLPALRDIKDLGEPDQLVLPDTEAEMHRESQDAMTEHEVHG